MGSATEVLLIKVCCWRPHVNRKLYFKLMNVYRRGVAATLNANTRQIPRGHIVYFEEIEDPERTEPGLHQAISYEA